MASLHRDQKSPFWYLRYRDGDGKWRSKATPYRHAIASETRKARQLEADTTATERHTGKNSPIWKTWVSSWISSHFSNPLTRSRVEVSWSAIEAFLEEQGLRHPALVERPHCFEYFRWRQKAGRWPGGRKRNAAHYNTAILELKFLSQIMREAKHRGYIRDNPAERLGLKKVSPKEKEPLTDEQIIRIREECERQDAEFAEQGDSAWMTRCFKIALCQGVRLRETQVPLKDVHLDSNVIVFNNTKRG